MGRATLFKGLLVFLVIFQSTPSVGRATIKAGIMQSTNGISIHALRGEGDAETLVSLGLSKISIHALRGEGDTTARSCSTQRSDFNPRPPWGGRLNGAARLVIWLSISIHALRGEGDLADSSGKLTYDDFNPRPPWGGRRLISLFLPWSQVFQSTPSVGRATRGT